MAKIIKFPKNKKQNYSSCEERKKQMEQLLSQLMDAWNIRIMEDKLNAIVDNKNAIVAFFDLEKNR